MRVSTHVATQEPELRNVYGYVLSLLAAVSFALAWLSSPLYLLQEVVILVALLLRWRAPFGRKYSDPVCVMIYIASSSALYGIVHNKPYFFILAIIVLALPVMAWQKEKRAN